MTNRLPAWLFIALGVVIMSLGLAPLLRAIIGIDAQIQMTYFTVVTVLIGGLMCGLTGMILLSRKPAPIVAAVTPFSDIIAAAPVSAAQRRSAALLHLTGLLIFSGIPLLNFFVCYWLWLKTRDTSAYLDYQGREALNMQIAVYLYLLMSLFMAYVFVGVFMVLLVLLFALLVSVYAAIQAARGEWFRYPASMAIISRAVPRTR